MKTLKIKKIPLKELVVWGLLYLLFIEHGTNIFNFAHMKVALPITLLVLFIFLFYRCTISYKTFLALGILFINHLITGTISNASISEGFNFSGWMEMAFVIMAVIVVYKLDDDAITKYIQLVFIFSLISLAFYFIVRIGAGRIITRLFGTYKTGMGLVSGKWLYAYNIYNPERNSGIFTEPGIFQVVLVMCIFVLIFLKERTSITNKQRLIYLAVLLLTLITTRSTAGYIGLFAIVVAALLEHKEKRDYIIVVILGLIVAFLVYNYYSQGNDSILQKYFFEKLAETQEKDLTASSGGARLVALKMGLEAAITHPFGIGYLNWEKQLYSIYGTKFGTGNALFTQLGTRGFIAFFISIYLALKPAFKNRKNWIEFLLFCFLFLYIATVQSKILYPSIMLVAYLPKSISNTKNKITASNVKGSKK